MKTKDGQIVEATMPELEEQYKPKTHADEVRAMNDEELANFLCDTSGMCAGCIAADFCKYGKIGFVEWLKQEAQSDT